MKDNLSLKSEGHILYNASIYVGPCRVCRLCERFVLMFDSSSYTLWKLVYSNQDPNNNGYKIYVRGWIGTWIGIVCLNWTIAKRRIERMEGAGDCTDGRATKTIQTNGWDWPEWDDDESEKIDTIQFMISHYFLFGLFESNGWNVPIIFKRIYFFVAAAFLITLTGLVNQNLLCSKSNKFLFLCKTQYFIIKPLYIGAEFWWMVLLTDWVKSSFDGLPCSFSGNGLVMMCDKFFDIIFV